MKLHKLRGLSDSDLDKLLTILDTRYHEVANEITEHKKKVESLNDSLSDIMDDMHEVRCWIRHKKVFDFVAKSVGELIDLSKVEYVDRGYGYGGAYLKSNKYYARVDSYRMDGDDIILHGVFFIVDRKKRIHHFVDNYNGRFYVSSLLMARLVNKNKVQEIYNDIAQAETMKLADTLGCICNS